MDLQDVTHETFAGRIGEHFLLQPEGAEPVDLVLVECREYRADVGRPPEAARRLPFSLFFLGPSAPILPQRIYPAMHAELGELDLFFVPVGQDASGTTYEVVFG